jgi:hypothetical protein
MVSLVTFLCVQVNRIGGSERNKTEKDKREKIKAALFLVWEIHAQYEFANEQTGLALYLLSWHYDSRSKLIMQHRMF